VLAAKCGVAVLLGFYKLRPNLRQNSAVSFANNELSTTQSLWRVPLTRILVVARSGREDQALLRENCYRSQAE